MGTCDPGRPDWSIPGPGIMAEVGEGRAEIAAAETRRTGRSPETTVQRILRLACQEFGIFHDELLSQRRRTNLVHARWVAMFLMDRHTRLTLPQMGRVMAGMDHTSVMHGIRRMKELIASDPVMAARVAAVEAELTKQG